MKMVIRLVQWIVERKVRTPVGYLRNLGEASFSGFLKLLLILPLVSHRGQSDPLLLHAARIVATQHEDCASCLQMAMNVAADEGMEPETIRAILSRDYQHLPASISHVVQFTEGLLARNGSEGKARHVIESRYGATVLAELALAIAGARVFPTIKQGLGLAVGCSATNTGIDSHAPLTAR